MDLLAFILALTVTDEQAQSVLSNYINEHPEAVIDVDVATEDEATEYLGIIEEEEEEQEGEGE